MWRFASKPLYRAFYVQTSTSKQPNLSKLCVGLHQILAICILCANLLRRVWGSASFCRKEALQSCGCAKADIGILAERAWRGMGRGFVFLGVLAFAWKVHSTMVWEQKLTWVKTIITFRSHEKLFTVLTFHKDMVWKSPKSIKLFGNFHLLPLGGKW